MNVLVVDTSSWISYFRGRPQSDLEIALEEGRAYLSPIVAAELVSGVKKASEQKQLINLLKDLPLVGGELAHWIRVGELRARLAQKGISVSTPDAHVAQCALDLDGYLLSEDQIFSKIAHHSKLKMVPGE